MVSVINLPFKNYRYCKRISNEPQLRIPNKSFIHSPGKEKAKTSSLSLGRIGESVGEFSGSGIIDKT